MAEDQICRTLSVRGPPVDYRPSLHHNQFKTDSTFDIRHGAVVHCNEVVDRTLQAVFESYHKPLFGKLSEEIKNKDSSAINISFVSTGFSDGDRDYFINKLIPKLQQETSCFVVDPVYDGCQSARDLLVSIADSLNCKLVDRASFLRNKGAAPAYTQSSDTIRDTPLRAINAILSTRNANNTARKNTKNSDSSDLPQLVVVLRFTEMMSMHILNNLIALLSGPKVGFCVHIVAFTDVLCPLPVQFSATTQSLIRASLHYTVAPFELYDALCVGLFDGRELPVVLSKEVVQGVHAPFKESEMCLTSAVNRIKVCLGQHFQDRLSVLCMYRETAWLQKMNILSRSQSQFVPSAALRRVGSVGSAIDGRSSRSAGSRGTKDRTTSAECSVSNDNNTEEHTLGSDDEAEEGSVGGNSTIITTATTNTNTATLLTNTTLNTYTAPINTLSMHNNTTSITRMKHQHGLIALLQLLIGSDLAAMGVVYSGRSGSSGVSSEQVVILEVFEVYDMRLRVDTVWFSFMKMLRDQLLPPRIDDRRFSADLLWADILCPDAATLQPSPTLNPFRLHTSLLHLLGQQLHTVSAAFIQAAVSNIRELACRCRAEVGAVVECIQHANAHNTNNTNPTTTGNTTNPTTINTTTNTTNTSTTSNPTTSTTSPTTTHYTPYLHFLQQLEDGARDIEVTFEGVGEYLQNTGISLHLSLKKMKDMVRSSTNNTTTSNSTTTTTSTTGTTNTTHNTDTNTTTIPDLSYSKESCSVTYNSINFYEEALVDLTNWLTTIALHYATLPTADSIVAQVRGGSALYANNTSTTNGNTGGKATTKAVTTKKTTTTATNNATSGSNASITTSSGVSMRGVLYLQAQAQERTLAAIDGNLHARFASALKAPRDFTSTTTSTTTTSTTTTSTTTTSFTPDSSVLYSMIRTCRQKEVAGVWYEQFCKNVTVYSGASAAGTGRGKRKHKSLDGGTVLKCRFASALYDIENSGIVKCSRTSAQNPTVTIERKIYTWVL